MITVKTTTMERPHGSLLKKLHWRKGSLCIKLFLGMAMGIGIGLAVELCPVKCLATPSKDTAESKKRIKATQALKMLLEGQKNLQQELKTLQDTLNGIAKTQKKTEENMAILMKEGEIKVDPSLESATVIPIPKNPDNPESGDAS